MVALSTGDMHAELPVRRVPPRQGFLLTSGALHFNLIHLVSLLCASCSHVLLKKSLPRSFCLSWEAAGPLLIAEGTGRDSPSPHSWGLRLAEQSVDGQPPPRPHSSYSLAGSVDARPRVALRQHVSLAGNSALRRVRTAPSKAVKSSERLSQHLAALLSL